MVLAGTTLLAPDLGIKFDACTCCRNVITFQSVPSSDQKRKLNAGKDEASNGGLRHGKQKKEGQQGKFKKDKHGKFGKKTFK